MTPTEAAVLKSAKRWWMSHRPYNFTKQQHLRHPAINTHSYSERVLAKAIADWIRQGATPDA